MSGLRPGEMPRTDFFVSLVFSNLVSVAKRYAILGARSRARRYELATHPSADCAVGTPGQPISGRGGASWAGGRAHTFPPVGDGRDEDECGRPPLSNAAGEAKRHENRVARRLRMLTPSLPSAPRLPARAE